jgi:carbonic anhydrase
MRGLLASSLKPASLVGGMWKDTGKGPGSRAGEFIEWLTITDQRQSVLDDVARIKSHPLAPADIAVHGYIYDIGNGRLNAVSEGKRRGAASAAG